MLLHSGQNDTTMGRPATTSFTISWMLRIRIG